MALCERLFQYTYFSSHIGQIDVKYLHTDMIVPVVVMDHVVFCATLFLTGTQAGDPAMAESLPLVPRHHHTTTQRHLEMQKTCLRFGFHVVFFGCLGFVLFLWFLVLFLWGFVWFGLFFKMKVLQEHAYPIWVHRLRSVFEGFSDNQLPR